MTDHLPRAVWSGSFMIGEIEMRCHVLEDGRRIIDAESMEALLGGDALGDDTADAFAEFMRWAMGDVAP